MQATDGRQWHVTEGTDEHKKLVAEGAAVIDDPTTEKKASRSRKADDADGETLGE